MTFRNFTWITYYFPWVGMLWRIKYATRINLRSKTIIKVFNIIAKWLKVKVATKIPIKVIFTFWIHKSEECFEIMSNHRNTMISEFTLMFLKFMIVFKIKCCLLRFNFNRMTVKVRGSKFQRRFKSIRWFHKKHSSNSTNLLFWKYTIVGIVCIDCLNASNSPKIENSRT